MSRKSHKVLFASSEAVPFAKVGGLADMVTALGKALVAENQNVKIILPKYRSASQYLTDHEIPIISSYRTSVSFNDHEYFFTIEEAKFQENTFIFIDIPEYFDRDHPYIDTDTGHDYQDNLLRFSLFNRAVLEACKIMLWIPDIIHCHDWHMGLIPVFKKALPEYYATFQNTKVIYTIHNLAYQGVFTIDQYPIIGLEWKYVHVNGLEYYRHINLMKGGIVFSDAVNTVSQTYAQEIQQEANGVGLDGVIRDKKIYGIFCGIMNGVDYSEWDPSIDEYTEKIYGLTYNIETLDKKELIKKKYCTANHIQYNNNTPLIGIITRLYDQKGLDILLECIEVLLQQNIAFTILGTGKKEYEHRLVQLSEQYPHLMHVTIGFNIELSHLIEAASDMFLMPSQFEPSGLNQLYSLRYGTVPIVRKTGGLADSVTHMKSGFLFEQYHPTDLCEVIIHATSLWRGNKPLWEKILKTGMKEDWSWKRSAKGYLSLYNQVL